MEIGTFISQYEGFIKARSRAIARDYIEADELFQKAAIVMWQHCTRLYEMNPPAIRSFLGKTVKNALIDIRRQEKHITTYDIDMPTPNFESEVLDKMLIQSIIHKLNPREQEIIFLAYQMGMDSKEIGKQLSIPATTVRSQKARAQQKLKKLLSEKETKK